MKRVRDQWPEIPYRGPDGRRHTHVFDFWVERHCGRREAIAVRTSKRVHTRQKGQPSLAETISLISPRDLAPFADHADIFDESDVRAGALYNARKILRAREYRNERDVQEALRLVLPLRGAVRFHDLIRGAPVPATRRIALWCLIDDGILHAAENGPINDACRVLANHELIPSYRRAA